MDEKIRNDISSIASDMSVMRQSLTRLDILAERVEKNSDAIGQLSVAIVGNGEWGQAGVMRRLAKIEEQVTEVLVMTKKFGEIDELKQRVENLENWRDNVSTVRQFFGLDTFKGWLFVGSVLLGLAVAALRMGWI